MFILLIYLFKFTLKNDCQKEKLSTKDVILNYIYG